MSLIHKIASSAINKGKREYDPENPKDYSVYRANAEKHTRKVPRSIKCENIKLKNATVEILTSPKNPKDKVVFYIHGGGFTEASPTARRMFTLYVVRKLGYNVASVDYRLAPENKYPTAVEDCFEAYKYVLERYGLKLQSKCYF